MRSAEEVAREVFDEHVHWGQQAWDETGVVDLIRARDAEVREAAKTDDPILRAWVEPGINPPYHERMKVRVRKIMPTLGRALDAASEERR